LAIRKQIDSGGDPIAEHRAAKQTALDLKAGIGTLAHLFTLYEDPMEGGAPASWLRARPTVERVFKDLLPKPVATIEGV